MSSLCAGSGFVFEFGENNIGVFVDMVPIVIA